MLMQLLILAIIVGAVVYIVKLLPVDETIKRVVVIIAVVALAIYALKVLLPMAGLG